MPAANRHATPPATPTESATAQRREARRGVGFGLAAYGIWGCFPLFFALFDGVPAGEILIHRILWSCLFLALVISLMRRWAPVRAAFRQPRRLLPVLGCALLIGLNWGLYIYAVESQHVLQASLGYFITPLVNVALGMLILKERLSRWQGVAIALALIAILIQLVMLGRLPWISLVLAATFGTYGLLRKQVPLDGLSGLFAETTLLLPFSLVALTWLMAQNASHFGIALTNTTLLVVSGVLTTLPLLAFAGAARRLRLSTVGFLMYINPTLQFALALWVFDEPLSLTQLTTFVLIWVGLACYSLDAWRGRNAR